MPRQTDRRTLAAVGQPAGSALWRVCRRRTGNRIDGAPLGRACARWRRPVDQSVARGWAGCCWWWSNGLLTCSHGCAAASSELCQLHGPSSFVPRRFIYHCRRGQSRSVDAVLRELSLSTALRINRATVAARYDSGDRKWRNQSATSPMTLYVCTPRQRHFHRHQRRRQAGAAPPRAAQQSQRGTTDRAAESTAQHRHRRHRPFSVLVTASFDFRLTSW